jgi:MFS family permease
LLRYADFRRLIIAQFVSQVSDAAGTVILAGIVLFLSTDGPATAQLAAMISTSAVPLVIAGPLSGFVADRFSRRSILFNGQLLRVALAIALLIGSVLGLDALLFVIWAVALCVAKILYTARYASIRHLVRHHELVAADSTSLTMGTIAGVIGGILGAGLLWSIGSIGFVLVALGHALSALVVRRVTASTGGGREHSMAGWRAFFDHLNAPKLRYAMVTTGALRLLLGVVLACMVSMGSSAGGHSPSVFATIMAASGLGTFIGSNTAEWVNEVFNRKTAVILIYLGTACILVITAVHTRPVMHFVGFGVCSFLFQNLRLCADATIQSNSLSGAGGREFALYDINHNLLFLVGILIGLVSSPGMDRRLIIAVCGFLSVFGGIASLFLSRGEVSDDDEDVRTTRVDTHCQLDRTSQTARLRSKPTAVRAPG